MGSHDTTPAAEAVQLGIQRAMSGERRLLLALDMSVTARDLAIAGIHSDHPEWSEAEVRRELLRHAFIPGQLPVRLR